MTDVNGVHMKDRILVVEDDPSQLKIIIDILAAENLQSLGCQTGQEAIAACAQQDLNIAILDLRLPDMSGLEVLKALKAANPEMKVIINTAYATLDAAVMAVNEEAFAFVQKMGDVDELLAHVHRARHALLVGYSEKLERDVRKRTAELEEANEHLKTEIAERKQAEERLQTQARILESMVEGVNVSDENALIFFTNPAFDAMFGYERGELMGQHVSVLNASPPEENARIVTEIIEQLRTQGAWFGEFSNRKKDGTLFTTHARISALEISGKTYWISVQEDITERKQAEEALQRYAERLETLHEIDQAILAARSPEAIAEAALDRLYDLMPLSRATVGVFDYETMEAVGFVSRPDAETGGMHRARLPLEQTLGFDAMRQGKVNVVEDLQRLDSPSPFIQTLQAEGLRSVISVPLLVQEELIGALYMGSESPGAFSDDQIEIAREVADLLAVALQQARLFEEIHTAHERLKRLARQLVDVQEAERRHLARELHDEIGQVLTAVRMSLQAAQQLPEAATRIPALEEGIGAVDRALEQIHALSLDLRPALLDDLGLAPTIRWYVDRQAQRAGFTARVVADAFEERLPPALEIACFRVVQEALTNVMRHAQARQVQVELRNRETEVELVIRDDGVGFDVEAAMEQAAQGASLGLLSMQERTRLVGGHFEITAAPGQGAEIRARFPLSSPEEHGEKRGAL